MAQAVCEWGPAAVQALRERVSVFVIVDILSFSSAVDIAASRGAIVYPFPDGDGVAAETAARSVGAVLAQPRRVCGGQFSLSPQSLLGAVAGLKLMLPSPNGSRISHTAAGIPVLAGCLRNASMVATAAKALAGSGDIAVVPAGERWPDGSLRPAIEDLLGAGAILDRLRLPCSPEARVARDAFRSAGDDIADMIRDSISGQELIQAGFSGDVELAIETDVSSTAPVLHEGAFRQM
jgi:2-phosphosulfolactate phosphatase